MQHRRGPWSQHEDATLLSLVQVHGPHNWVRISQLVTSRSPKQCRERYHQNLKPTLNHDPITPEEGVVIERLVAEMGKRWAEIARRLHGRSDNAVKNWWNGGMNRRRRMCLRQRPHQAGDESPLEEEPSSPYSVCSHSSDTFSHELPRINSSLIPRREDDDLLPSPSLTAEFMRSSRGQTPSMMSDSTSVVSVSPRLPPSPLSQNNSALTLPPLINPQAARRQSLPILSLTEQHAQSQRSSCDSGYQSNAPSDGPSQYHYLRHKVPTILKSDTKTEPKSKPRRPNPIPMRPDIRMNLASILG